jgi:uncharacterized membrane protein
MLREHFFSGVLVLIPIGVAIWLLGTVVSTLWQLQEVLPDAWRPESYLTDSTLRFVVNLGIVLTSTLILSALIGLVGWVSHRFLGQKILEFLSQAIQRIPVVRSVYSALDQLLKTLAANGDQQFNRVVYVEYPRAGVWTIAFVTGESLQPKIQSDQVFLNVYVPTTPNPTSGFFLMVPENQVRESGMKVEEAFKTILSLGIAAPKDHSA